jgi:hypothetical protein
LFIVYRERVMMANSVSAAFSTLRDVRGINIIVPRENLKFKKRLG